jgi:uncharacterized protein YqhQ
MAEKRVSVGGQAVIEGVMMRSPTFYATAVRTPQGRIVIQKIRFSGLTHRFKWLNIPIIRGAISLVETLWIGIQSLSYSASQAMEEEEKPAKKKGRLTSWLSIAGSIVFALGAGFLLFFFVPLWLTELLPIENGILFNIIDGIFRLAMFLGYVVVIARWKEMRRVFQYHGAEHKTIYTFENGKNLTTENARDYSTLHPRCGTSFLLVVMLVSVLVFAFLGRPDDWGDRLLRFAMIPLIGGIAFEFVKLSSKERFARYFRFAIWPGLTLQRITTREPSEDMLEVAIAALDACLDYQSVKLELPAS